MSPPQKGEASRKRLPELPASTNQAAGYPFLGHQGYMRLLGDRIRWLERREHWWARSLRWHRERYGPGCGCRSCTREAAA